MKISAPKKMKLRSKRNGKASRQSRIRVHMAESPQMPIPWRITRDRFERVVKQFPELNGRYAVTFGDNTRNFDGDLASAEVLLAGRVDWSNLAERAPALKWVQSTSVGIEKILPFIPDGVLLTNTSGVETAKTGEYLLTGLLMLNNRVPHFVTRQRENRWDQLWSTEITGKTVVVLGTGAIGSSIARLARRFKMRVIGISRSGKPNPLFNRVHRPKELDRVLPLADFVVVATPLTPETNGMLGRAQLDLLPQHAGIVNVGRARVIDYEALMDKLRNGQLSGAVLDVFPDEPLSPDSPIWSTPNVIVSPHCAIDDAEAWRDCCFELFFSNLARYAQGRRPLNVVDRNRGY